MKKVNILSLIFRTNTLRMEVIWINIFLKDKVKKSISIILKISIHRIRQNHYNRHEFRLPFLYLEKHKISFQVVPGITAASGIASYSGIPLTHRDHAQSCLFLTGHLKDGVIDFDWPKLIIENQTLVVYMGLLSLNELVDNLINHGMAKKMPIALVESGTTSKQKVITGILSNIKSKVSKSKVKSPALIIVGTVVTLRDKLNWFK